MGCALGAAEQESLFNLKDILESIRLLALVPVSLAVPASRWWPVCRGIAGISAKLLPGPAAARGKHIASVLGGDYAIHPGDIVQSFVSESYLLRLHVLRMNVRKNWLPEVVLEGEDNLKRALADGRGAVLWVSDNGSASLVAKVAVADAGYAVHHLSRPTHGFSHTRYGRRILNSVRTSVESRFVSERVLIQDRNPTPAVRKLRKLLSKNQAVSITVGGGGVATTTCNFFTKKIRLATGAPQLAYAAKAPILPVFSRHDDKARHVVEIGAPLVSEPVEDAAAYVDAATRAYVQRLEANVAACPSGWQGWFNVAAAKGSSD